MFGCLWWWSLVRNEGRWILRCRVFRCRVWRLRRGWWVRLYWWGCRLRDACLWCRRVMFLFLRGCTGCLVRSLLLLFGLWVRCVLLRLRVMRGVLFRLDWWVVLFWSWGEACGLGRLDRWFWWHLWCWWCLRWWSRWQFWLRLVGRVCRFLFGVCRGCRFLLWIPCLACRRSVVLVFWRCLLVVCIVLDCFLWVRQSFLVCVFLQRHLRLGRWWGILRRVCCLRWLGCGKRKRPYLSLNRCCQRPFLEWWRRYPMCVGCGSWFCSRWRVG